ncbi:MAG TPA: YdeI/OmpD-associated family protein [Terriglobia bacterium]|nr:YdeI/OmpD-associated family protein [Terriglobia bacterium]
MNKPKQFAAVVARVSKDTVYIPIPFNPDEIWGRKPRHHVAGWINDHKVRGALTSIGKEPALTLGLAWRRDTGISAGDRVTVTLSPEGPQRDALEADFAAALEEEPNAAAFFDGLAQFYRRGYLTWIDATKKSPDERARRIAQTVKLLRSGVKQRPK